jgi:putative hydrolase of the HAD superfamily
MRAILFDLDNTLVSEMDTYESAFASAMSLHPLKVEMANFREAVFAVATELWLASPVGDYCARLGLGSPTSLFSDFPGTTGELAYLRKWSPGYRRETWMRALEKVGVNATSKLAVELDRSLRRELPSNIKRYDDVFATVETLSRSYVLAVATNGPADVQAAKLRGARLNDFFPIVVASSEVGFGKPDPRIFQAAVERMGVPLKEVLVVGDSLEKDVVGSAAAGLRCVWVNRDDTPRAGTIPPAFEIRSLAELPDLITQIPAD